MKRYRIPIHEHWSVTKAWVIEVEADSQAEAVELIEAQLQNDVDPNALRGVVLIQTGANDWEPEGPCEIQHYGIIEGPCIPDPRQTTLL